MPDRVKKPSIANQNRMFATDTQSQATRHTSFRRSQFGLLIVAKLTANT